MTHTYGGATQDLLDLLGDEMEETDRLSAELARHEAQVPETGPVDLDSITDRDTFYRHLTNVSPHGLPVDSDGNLDKTRPLFDAGGAPINEAAKQVLRERDPAFAAAEADADGRDYANTVKVIS